MDPRCIDLDAERAVLGACLQWDAHAMYAEQGMAATDFYRVAHARLWTACEAAGAETGRVDGLSVTRLLRARGWVDDIGGLAYMASLTDGVPQPDRVSAEATARHLRKLSRTRRMAQAARTLADDCDASYTGLEDDECAAHLAQMDALAQAGSAVRVLDAQGQVLDAMRAQYERQQQRSARFGVPALDMLLDGIRPRRVYGVLARTSVGKTNFACHVAATHGKDGAGMLFISLEMDASEVIGRLARVGLHAPDADRRIAEYADAYISHYGSVAICDKPGLTLPQIEQLIRSQQRVRSLATVVIDYIGLVRATSPGQSEYERLSEQAVELKEIAKRCGVAMMPLIQISRGQGGDGSEEVGLGSARGSGVIEEACDVGIGLRWLGAARVLTEQQRAEWRPVLWARCFKNRHGQVSQAETALRRDFSTMALTPDESLTFPDDMLRQANRANQKGGY